MLGMNTSSVTYQDLVREVWRVPTDDLSLALEFLRFLQTRHQPAESAPVNTAQSQLEMPLRRAIKSRPAAELLKWSGSIDLGEGNALEDTERLYDGN